MSHPVITLLSDLGTRDTTVTVAKAILMRYTEQGVIVDISHSVTQYNLQQAAYILFSAYRHFAKGTIHVVPMDVFTGHSPRIILAEKEGFYFIAPDNGLLALAFGNGLDNSRLIKRFSHPFAFADWINSAGEAVAQIISGLPLAYEPYEISVTPTKPEPKITKDGVECNILYIDRYENVVLDINKEQFARIINEKPFRIKVINAEDITTISNNYNDVPINDPLCRFNDAGKLEIALNHAPAATLLGLGPYHSGSLMYRTIKIFF